MVAASLVAALGTPKAVANLAGDDPVVPLFPQALRFEADWLVRNRAPIEALISRL